MVVVLVVVVVIVLVVVVAVIVVVVTSRPQGEHKAFTSHRTRALQSHSAAN